MPCVSPDGSLSTTGRLMLEAVGSGASAEEVAASTGKPLFSVRSSMRQLGEAGLVVETDGRFSQTVEGAAKAAEPD